MTNVSTGVVGTEGTHHPSVSPLKGQERPGGTPATCSFCFASAGHNVKDHMECIAAVCPPHTSFGSPGECQPQGKGQDLHVPLLYCMYGRHDTSIRLLAHFVRMDYTYDAIIRLVILFV